MNDKLQRDTANRLKSAAGHLQGVITMVEEDRYCIDIIKQVQAVQAALDKVNQLILDDHLHHCVITAVKGDVEEERERVLSELMTVFKSKK